MNLEKLEKILAETISRTEQTSRNIDRLEESQAKTDAQLAKTDAQLARTSAEFEKRSAKLDGQLARASAEFEKRSAKLDAQLARTDAKLARTSAELDKVGKHIKELSDMYGGVSEHLGDEAELDFFAALQEHPVLADVHYNDVDFDLTRKKGRKKVQLDLFLMNGDNIAIVEVKRHLQSKHIDRFHNHTIPIFRHLFPEFRDKNLYAALATYSIPKKAKKHVNKRIEQFGFGLLTPNRDGTRMVVDDHAMRVIT